MARVFRQRMFATTNQAGYAYRRFLADEEQIPIGEDERSIAEIVNSGDAQLSEFHPLYNKGIAVQNWKLAR